MFVVPNGVGADALLVGVLTDFARDSRSIIDLCARHRLPAIYAWPDQVLEGWA